jgi:hypothetical protein
VRYGTAPPLRFNSAFIGGDASRPRLRRGPRRPASGLGRITANDKEIDMSEPEYVDKAMVIAQLRFRQLHA